MLRKSSLSFLILLVSTAISYCQSIEIANHNKLIGDSLFRANQRMKAMPYFKKALKIKRQIYGEEHLEVAALYRRVGIGYYMSRKVDSCLNYFEKEMQILRSLNDTPGKIASAHNALSAAYRLTGNYEFALHESENSLKLIQDISREDPEFNLQRLGQAYNGVGESLRLLGSLSQASEYYHKALNLFQSEYDKNPLSVAGCLNNLANVNMKMGKFDTALQIHQKAFQIRQDMLGEKHHLTLQSLFNIAATYGDQKAYEKSFKIYRQLVKDRKSLFGESSIAVGDVYLSTAMIFKNQAKNDSALFYLDKVREIFKTQYDQNNPRYIKLQIDIGEVLLLEEKFSESKNFLRQAGEYNIEGKENLFHSQLLSSVLTDRLVLLEAMILEFDLYSTNHKNNPYYNPTRAAELLIEAGALIDELRGGYLRFDDKIGLNDRSTELYQKAVQFYIQAFKRSNERRYFERAFAFNEKSKSAILSDILSNRAIQHYANVPDSSIALEKTLKFNLTRYQSKVVELQKQKQPNSTQLASYQEKIFSTNRSLDSLKKEFSKNSPKYSKSLLEQSIIGFEEIQSQLDASQAIFEYFENNEELYTFVISKTSIDVIVEPFNPTLQADINRHQTFFQNKVFSKETFNEYRILANQLYTKLLKKALDVAGDKIEHLTIIPSSKLANLNFEILTTDTVGINFRELPYLINNYSINYAYSASLLYTNKPQADNTFSKNFLLGFAPKYESIYDDYDMKARFRDELIPLKFNTQEISNINNHINGEIFTNENATEKRFKQEAPNYQILHLAMHALLDHEEYMNSKLVFTQDNDSIEDGMLHTFELFNMDLQAEMVVLSACNTGIGTVKKGEGVLSLARGFAYAGVPSLVMSHWNVNDESTSKLMTRFYQYLSEGESKDVALRKAKLDFLENANEIQTNPFYWGGFVLVGDNSPINQSRNDYWWLLMLPALGFFWLSRKKR